MPQPHQLYGSDFGYSCSSESFCLSTGESGSSGDSEIRRSVPPTAQTKSAKPSSKPHPTIYSFAWSSSSSSLSQLSIQNNRNNSLPIMSLGHHIKRAVPSTGVHDTTNSNEEPRAVPPTLPSPVYWSSLTHPDIFKAYIDAERLIPVLPGLPLEGVSAAALTDGNPEPSQKPYTNLDVINIANTDKKKVVANCTLSWVSDFLFANERLPVPFQPSLLLSDPDLWHAKAKTGPGDHGFLKLPNLSKEDTAVEWLDTLGSSLGVLHGLGATNTSPDADSPIAPDHGNRTFNCEGHNRPLARGLVPRKPDIVVIDRSFRDNVPLEVQLRWPLVQALIEISTVEQRYTHLLSTLMTKASNIFDSQLQRRYVLGLGLFGKGKKVKFFFALIDRVGVISTRPTLVRGYNAITLARIVFAFMFAGDRLLGGDTRVTIDRFTGDPQSVTVGGQSFAIVTELYSSPYLFGRGTKVYVVKDQRGLFHVFKDSWILSTHTDSEIEHIKRISSAMEEEDLPLRARILGPRFVAGEDCVDDTEEPRDLLTGIAPARIRRRIVTGPLGDPITSYRSRVECLQALLDIIDELKFINDTCGLVHGDVSINNIIIVRFLPYILAASPVYSPPAPTMEPPAADPPSLSSGEQPAADLTSSTLNASVTAAPIDPALASLFATMNMGNDNQPRSWDAVKPCAMDGLPINVMSGGSLIDYDYTRAKDKVSMKTSGTLPYMAIDLMRPATPIAHRLDHDLESVCFVLLHLVRFTNGPASVSDGQLKPSYRVAVWHHEHNIDIIKDFKTMDVKSLIKDPKKYISEYWSPIAPHIAKLLRILSPDRSPDNTETVFAQVRHVLVDALRVCAAIPEDCAPYAMFQPGTAGSSRKRPSPQGFDENPKRKQLCQSLESLETDAQPGMTCSALHDTFESINPVSAFE